jgi:hypothetical protein
VRKQSKNKPTNIIGGKEMKQHHRKRNSFIVSK